MCAVCCVLCGVWCVVCGVCCVLCAVRNRSGTAPPGLILNEELRAHSVHGGYPRGDGQWPRVPATRTWVCKSRRLKKNVIKLPTLFHQVFDRCHTVVSANTCCKSPTMSVITSTWHRHPLSLLSLFFLSLFLSLSLSLSLSLHVCVLPHLSFAVRVPPTCVCPCCLVHKKIPQ